MIEWNENHGFDYLDTLLTEEERNAFEADVAAKGPCAEYLQKAQALRALLETSRLEAQDLDWVAIKRDIANSTNQMGGSNRWTSPWLWAPTLAASVILLAVFLPILTEDANNPLQAPLVGGESSNTPSHFGATPDPSGEVAWQTLGDGSVIKLSRDALWTQVSNVDGGIHIALTQGVLNARVVRSASRPYFRIVAADVTVEVLGTEFAVARSDDGMIQVDVVHGKVGVTSSESKVILTDGETFTHLPPNPLTANKANSGNEEQTQPGQTTIPRVLPAPTSTTSQKQNNPRNTKAKDTPSSRPSTESTYAKQSAPKTVPDKDVITPKNMPIQTAEASKMESKPVEPTEIQTRVEIERFTDPVQRSLAEIILDIRKGKLHRALSQLKTHQSTHAGHRNAMDAKYLEGYCLYKLGNKEQAMKIWEHYESRVRNGPWLRTVRDWTSPSVPTLERLR
jgi:hypothetical protein